MHFDKPTYTVRKIRKKDIPKGLYTKDPLTSEILFNKEVEDNQMVVLKSGHHFRIGARLRIAALFDEGSWTESDAGIRSTDSLKFVDSQPYSERLKRYEKDTGMTSRRDRDRSHPRIPISIAVMDFRYCGGSMGAAVGEKITRAIENAVARKIPASSSAPPAAPGCRRGSIRSCRWRRRAPPRPACRRGLPYISVLTDPQPGASPPASPRSGRDPGRAGRAGGLRRGPVIKNTTKQTLPRASRRPSFSSSTG